jgi:ABC-type uncharacterized transport system ATPase subunit
MVVDYRAMSSVDFGIPDFCLLIPNVPVLAGNFLAGLHLRQRWKRHGAASCAFKMNGAGKTTLFRMVVGEETPDEGAGSLGTDETFPDLTGNQANL